MTESIVQNPITSIQLNETPECKEVVTHGIYTVCADTGEVIGYDEEKYYVSNWEGRDDLTGRDRTFSHYKPTIPLLPSGGLGTIPMLFDHTLVYHSFANRVAMLISNSMLREVFNHMAQKLLHREIKDKLYVLGAFAIYYCNLDPNHIVQLILNYTNSTKSVHKVKRKLSKAILRLSYILKEELGSSIEEFQTLLKAKSQVVKEYTYGLLFRYGYTHLIDKFAKIYSPGLVKTAIILMLLRDNRRDEAIQLYNLPPRYATGLKRIIIDYEINGHMFKNKKLTHNRLRILLYNNTSKVYRIKIVQSTGALARS